MSLSATKLITALFFILACFPAKADDDKWKVTPTIDKKAPFGVYVPSDINDAHKELDNMLTSQFKKEIKENHEKRMTKYHFGLGGWMRNNWGLWSGSKLSEWFKTKGVTHPDDISAIILDSYCRYLRNEPLGLEKEFAYYIRYWKIREKPNDIPCENGKLLFGLTDTREVIPYYFHIARCPKEESYIVFDLDTGWYPATNKIIGRIQELKSKPGLISAPLEKPN